MKGAHMMKTEYKLQFLEEYRTHPDRYLPLIDHAWKVFPAKEPNAWDPEYNVGWNAGILEGNRPFFAECWATCGVTILTYFISVEGIGEYGVKELLGMLEGAGIIHIKDPEHPRAQALPFTDGNGNTFFSVNITVGDEEETYVTGGEIHSYKHLNEYNEARAKNMN